MFTDVFIRRPVLATVCSLLIMLAGAIAIPNLPIGRYPELAPPSVSVGAFYTGANAQAVESAVTTPLESVINGVEGMTYMTSSSTNSGVSSINVTFDIGRDADLAAVDVQNRVNSALGRLPVDVRTNGISVSKSSAGFLAAIGFFSDNNRYDSLFISNYLDRYVRDALKRVPGVASVIIFGERRFAMRLWLDPSKLAGRGLTAGDVTSALREQNVQVAAGSVGAEPSSADQMYQLSVRAAGRFTEANQFEDIVVKSGKDGALVRVKDIGRVELGAEDYSSRLRFAGVEASGIGIQLLPSANALETFRGVLAEMDRLDDEFPPGLKWQLAFDNVSIVRESIIEVLITLAEAIALVVAVMFLFLQNWRSTIIPAITIPVSLVGTFAFIKLLGFSINTLTLFGIVLATGIVVDDAIVVIENIERHITQFGKTAHEAASDAMREVFSAVVVIGIVLVSVFLPIAFFPGTTGRMYQQFSMTITFAVILSVFNAITFTPALAALLLEKETHEHGRFFSGVNRIIDGGTNVYMRTVHGALRAKWVMLFVFIAALGATWAVYLAVPRAFVPTEDEGYLMTIVQAPSGASIEYTTNIMKQAEAVYAKQPEIAGVFSVAGFSFSGAASNGGLMFVRLKEFNERKGKEHSLEAVINRVRGPLMGVPGALVIPVSPPSIQGLSAFGGFQFEVLDQTGGDINQLAAVTQQVAAAGNQSGKVAGLFSGFTANDPQLVVTLDRDRASSLGLPIGEITNALTVLLGSQYVNDFDFNNRAYRVYVQGDERFRARPDDLKQYYARASNGEMVPLSSVVKLTETTAPSVISHFNLFRSTEITGSAVPGVSSGQALQIMADIARNTLPQGFDFAWAGLSLEELQSGSQALYLFALSILLVYLVLAAQYESWVLPFIILLGVPLAVFGALSAQLVRGFANDVFCQVGLVMLIGLAAKNSILIVEFAEQLRAQGKSIADAAIESARIRLRPILMTSFAFILGVLPLAFASGAGSGARNSVGTAVAGGMLASTFLSIVFIPVLYVIIRTIAPGNTRLKASGSGLKATATVLALALGATLFTAKLSAQGQSAPATPEPLTPLTPLTMERLTLDEAVTRALANNLTIAQVAEAVLRAEGLLQQARSATRPSVNAFVTNATLDSGRDFSGTVVQPRNQSTISADLSMPVLAPARWAAATQARDQVEVATLSTADVRKQIAVATAEAYLAIISARRQVDVDQRAKEAAQAHLDYAQRRLAQGAGTRLNELRAAQEVAADDARIEVAGLAVRRAQEALGTLLAARGPVDAAAEPTFEIPAASVIDDETAWMTSRTDIRLSAATQRAFERVWHDSAKDYFPTAIASFDPQILAPSGAFTAPRSWRFVIALSQPIFDSGQRSGVAKVRAAAAKASQFATADLQIQARSEVRLAQDTVRSLERALASQRLAAQQANEVLSISTTAFEAGATTNLEVIDAQRSARDTDSLAEIAADAVRRAKLDLLTALGRFPQ